MLGIRFCVVFAALSPDHGTAPLQCHRVAGYGPRWSLLVSLLEQCVSPALVRTQFRYHDATDKQQRRAREGVSLNVTRSVLDVAAKKQRTKRELVISKI